MAGNKNSGSIKKGEVRNPKGRPPGPNKATLLGREAIANFVDGNAHRLLGWLDQIAEKDPDAAFKAFMSVVEYHIPKLSRVDKSFLDADGNPAGNTLRVEIIKVDRHNSDS